MSSELFQIHCPNCGSKLNAKANLIGQTRKCPKCATPFVVQHPEIEPATVAEEGGLYATGEAVPESAIVLPPIANTLGGQRGPVEPNEPVVPTRLEFRNRYLILNPDRIIALWELGKGWQINVGNGFASAKKNVAAIPDQGTFAFVELVIGASDEETSTFGGPRDLHVFRVSVRGALTSLYRDDNEILNKVDGPATLNAVQKNALSNYLRQHFMVEGLADADAVFAALSMES